MWLKVPINSGVFPEIARVDADLRLQLPQQLRTTVAAQHDGVSRRRPKGSDMVEEQLQASMPLAARQAAKITAPEPCALVNVVERDMQKLGWTF